MPTPCRETRYFIGMPPSTAGRPPEAAGTRRPAGTLLAVLNGVIGDYLHRRGNPLATEGVLLHRGAPLALEPDALRQALPGADGRLAVWVHGLCTDEEVWTVPEAPGLSFPRRLEEELGFVPLLLRYNSGRHVSDSGELLAAMLERLVESYPAPLEELLLVGFSMGGLVIRSALHAAAERDHAWVRSVRQAIYIGTPHLGTPVERLGRGIAWTLRTVPHPITRLVAAVADLRSAGIQDMGHGRLIAGHWRAVDPAALRPAPHPFLPLPPGIRHGLIAGRLRDGDRASILALLGDGDGMVPLASACAGHACRDRLRVVGGVGHVGLVRHPEVWDQLLTWCAEGGR
jgi:hypothetical protein